MRTCQYAACDQPATSAADGWAFCASHLAQHHALLAEEAAPPPVTRRPVAMDQADRIRDLHAEGLNDRQIAWRVGLSRYSIANVRSRLALPPNREPRQRPVMPCGTRAAYQRHRRRGEKACGPCYQAHLEYERAWMARNRRRAS